MLAERYQVLKRIQGRHVTVVSLSNSIQPISFLYESIHWEINKDVWRFFDGWRPEKFFSISIQSIRDINIIIDETYEKVIQIITTERTFTFYSKIQEDEIGYYASPLYYGEIDFLEEIENKKNSEICMSEFEDKLMYYSKNNKNIIVQIEEPLMMQQVFSLVRCEIFNNDIFLDGENTTMACFNIKKKDVTSIQQKEKYITVYLMGGISILINEIESNPKIWTRSKMEKSLERSGGYEYR